MPWNWRWAAVGAVGLALISVPSIISALPVGTSNASAASLLSLVQHSSSATYSGYAEADGGLDLPLTSEFGSLADLLGGQSQLRVWWRGSSDWRIDTISLTGESDQYQSGNTLWDWDYEANEATQIIEPTPPAVRLPESGDVLPTTLALRLTSEATPSEATRLPVRRIAGHDVPGIRVRPRETASTVDEVDIWVDPHSGAALRVEVHSASGTALSTQFLEFSSGRPAASVTNFSPPPTARVRQSSDPDLAAFIDRLGIAQPPSSLAGLARNPQLPPIGSIGVYGSAVTELVASPLFGDIARGLSTQLAKTAGVITSAAGQLVTVGPLSLLLTGPGLGGPDRFRRGGGAWLLVGTVTPATLTAAAKQIGALNR